MNLENRRRTAAWRDRPLAVCSLCAQEIHAGETLWYRNGQAVCPDCFPRFAREELRAFEYILGEETAQ